MIKEFKEFAIKGNVVDLAVGVIIGASFGSVIKSLVDDVIMPPIGYLLGNVDFSNMFFLVKEGNPPLPYNTLADAVKAGAVVVKFGLFLNTVIAFLIVALCVFLLVRQIQRLKKSDEKVAAAPTAEVSILTEIRDLLKNK